MNIIFVQLIDYSIYVCDFVASVPDDPKVNHIPGCQCCKEAILGKTDDGKIIPGIYSSHRAESSYACKEMLD